MRIATIVKSRCRVGQVGIRVAVGRGVLSAEILQGSARNVLPILWEQLPTGTGQSSFGMAFISEDLSPSAKGHLQESPEAPHTHIQKKHTQRTGGPNSLMLPRTSAATSFHVQSWLCISCSGFFMRSFMIIPSIGMRDIPEDVHFASRLGSGRVLQ